VDDSGSALIVLLLGDPHLLEGGEGCQDGATDPDGVLPLGRSDDLDLHGGGSHGGDLLLHAVGDAGVHRRPTRKHRVGVQVLSDINVAFHDGIEGAFVDPNDLHSDERRTEHRLWATESFVSDRDYLSVGQLV